MLTCGTYDEAGDFVFHVGLPGKSVGGGIAAIIPGKLSVALWNPALNYLNLLYDDKMTKCIYHPTPTPAKALKRILQGHIHIFCNFLEI